MIYTSGTNRILTINEADSTKVGWVADKNDTTNGKLVFSDADVNWAGNSKSVTVSGTTTSLNQSINCSTISYNGPTVTVKGTELNMSYNNNLGYIQTANYLTFLCGDTSGDGDFVKRSGTILQPLYTKVNFGDSSSFFFGGDAKGRTLIRIYNNSNLIEFRVIRNGLIGSAYHTLALPACTNSITPPGASVTPGCSYTPNPILSVENGALPGSSLISTTFNRTANLIICYAAVRYNSEYTNLRLVNKTYVSYPVTIAENGYISGLGSSYIDINTTNITPNYIVGWIGFSNRNLSKTYTYRGHGNLSVTRSTGYSGIATVTADEKGTASITQIN